MLYLFGASDATYPYADAYIYNLSARQPVRDVGLGMNSFINSQDSRRIGADDRPFGRCCQYPARPDFYLYASHGIRGAALATILSQLLSAIWILRFLTSDKTI